MSRGKSSIDPRYLSNTNINDFGLDLSTFPSVLSTTPTPSFDTFGAIQHGGNDRVILRAHLEYPKILI